MGEQNKNNGGDLMKIQSLKLVCFSPTGTTKAIIQGVARGINQSTVELIDITKPNARKQQLQTSENELLVVAVPVYMGRVPALLMEWLHAIKARNTPTVCIVVYGNRVYDDALLELAWVFSISSTTLKSALRAANIKSSFSIAVFPFFALSKSIKL